MNNHTTMEKNKKAFEEMKAVLEECLLSDYEHFVMALTSLETGVNDFQHLVGIYYDWLNDPDSPSFLCERLFDNE